MKLNPTCVVINDRVFYTHPSPRHKTDFYCNGAYFETEEELLIAEMLIQMGISFLHHVNFVIKPDYHKGNPIIWCPDFVFDRPYIWNGPMNTGTVIVGLEAKYSKISGKPKHRAHQVFAQFGVTILIVNRSHITPYYGSTKRLPLIAV